MPGIQIYGLTAWATHGWPVCRGSDELPGFRPAQAADRSLRGLRAVWSEQGHNVRPLRDHSQRGRPLGGNPGGSFKLGMGGRGGKPDAVRVWGRPTEENGATPRGCTWMPAQTMGVL